MLEHTPTGKLGLIRLAYDPITLEYHKTQKGDVLKDKDDKAKFRAKLRAKNLDYRSNTGYNILTGEDRVGVDLPNDVFQKYAENVIIPRKTSTNLW